MLTLNKSKITVSVHQPGYHRYIGYFYKIMLSDVFISFDIVQYVLREFQNRQRFFYDGSFHWLTVPVNRGREPICDKKIVDPRILKDHWKTLENIYRKAPFFDLYRDQFQSFYNKEHTKLAGLCDDFSIMILDILGINTHFIKASSYLDNTYDYKKAKLIAEVVKAVLDVTAYESVTYLPRHLPVPENHYLYNSAGNGEKEINLLMNEGIKVDFYKFKHPIYEQHFSENSVFIENLSIIDLLFWEGPNSINILKSSGNLPN